MSKFIPKIGQIKLWMLYNDEELEGDNEKDTYSIFDEDFDDILEEWENA